MASVLTLLMISGFLSQSCVKQAMDDTDSSLIQAASTVYKGGSVRNQQIMEDLHDDAVGELVFRHYANLSTLAQASGELSEYLSQGGVTLSLPNDASPFLLFLLDRDIVDEETKQPINISILDPLERGLLLADMMMDDMERVTSRLRASPEAQLLYSMQVEAVEAVAEGYRCENNAFKLLTDAATAPYSAGMLDPMAFALISGPAVDPLEIHSKVQAALAEMTGHLEEGVDEPTRKVPGVDPHVLPDDDRDNRGGTKSPESPEVSLQIVLKAWNQHSARGHLLIRLPNHYSPRTWMKNTFREFGHVGIMSTHLDLYAKMNELASIDADPKRGVHRRKVGAWLRKHYVARIDHVQYARKPRKWWQVRGERYEKSRTPIDGNAFATLCESYMGRNYTPIYNMPIMKNEAPATFTCTTLAWYCAQRSNNVDISNTSWQIIYPNEVYLDDNVTILANVKE